MRTYQKNNYRQIKPAWNFNIRIMNLRLLSYPLLMLHAELVSASHICDNECVIY